MLQLDQFYKARYVLSNVLRKTELIHAKKINPDVDVYLKPECLQLTGSFKLRGAYFKISQLSDEEKKKLLFESNDPEEIARTFHPQN